MENYSYQSYPDSGDSSPRSRDIDFENPTPWEEHQQPPANYKAKFMCSYGGKIHPRPHDNQLAYIGGETKILAVERSCKLPAFLSKLAALCGGGDPSDVSFKYQLPGEDLDALISVTNDDDLEHMMTEYDRLYRASAKPARLRLFLFQANPPPQPQPSPPSSAAAVVTKSDRDRFVDALNSGPAHPADPSAAASAIPPNHVDFLFGLDKGNLNANPNPNPHPPSGKLRDPAAEAVVPEPEMRPRPPPVGEDRVTSPDPHLIPVDIQRHIQDLQRLQLQDQAAAAAAYRRKSEEALIGPAGDFYVQKLPEKAPAPPNLPGSAPTPVTVPAGYWPPEKHIPGGVSAGGGFQASGGEPPVYMIPAAAGVYHPPVGRPVGPQATQGYYQVQRMGSDPYREPQQQQPPPQAQHPPQGYGMFTAALPQQVSSPPQPPPQKVAGYSEGMGMMRPVGGGVTDHMGYAQVAYDSAGRQVYDSAGRQVYYTAPAGMVQAPYPAVAAVSPDLRQGPVGALGQEAKVAAAKVSQTSL